MLGIRVRQARRGRRDGGNLHAAVHDQGSQKGGKLIDSLLVGCDGSLNTLDGSVVRHDSCISALQPKRGDVGDIGEVCAIICLDERVFNDSGRRRLRLRLIQSADEM